MKLTHREYMRRWRQRPGYDWRRYSNPTVARLAQARWIKRNHEEIKNRRRAKYQSSIDQQRAYHSAWKRNWREKNPEKARLSEKRRSPEAVERRRIRNREYRKTHRADHAHRNKIRQVLKLGCVVQDRGRIKRIYERAAKLREAGLNVHVDHKIALSRGGRHSPDNLQIITASENNRKYSKSDYVPIFVFE